MSELNRHLGEVIYSLMKECLYFDPKVLRPKKHIMVPEVFVFDPDFPDQLTLYRELEIMIRENHVGVYVNHECPIYTFDFAAEDDKLVAWRRNCGFASVGDAPPLFMFKAYKNAFKYFEEHAHPRAPTT
jgi:hypothetical protein